MTIRQHFATRFRLDSEARFLVWISDSTDGVVLDDGCVATFGSIEDLEHFAAARGLALSEHEDGAFEFDAISAWIASPSAASIDCDLFLNAWNLLLDITDSLGIPPTLSDDEKAILETLFWGCNLPSMTPPGEHFVPTWSATRIAIMRSSLQRELTRFRLHHRPCHPSR